MWVKQQSPVLLGYSKLLECHFAYGMQLRPSCVSWIKSCKVCISANDYTDDLFIASSNPEEHKQHLWLVFEWLQDHGVVINPAKCVAGITLLQFLGHQIDSQGICHQENKVWDVQEFAQPTTQYKLCKLLGLVKVYHCFLPNATQILQQLYKLLTDTTDGII